MSINIPKNMKLKMKHGKLNNGINYVVIKDNDATVANVGIGIKIGRMYDPIDNMGMAHFLEHMLFLGSMKYKEESYFDTMIKQYGGSSNAYTASFETVYHFNVLAEHLDEILDIFSRFFIDPLFDVNSVSREINAINSEHMKNINNEFWIIRQLIRDISDNDSIIHRFTTGSHDTLSKKYTDLRNKMVDFYNKYYCSENLYIVVQSNMDIGIVEKMILQYFNIIENRKCVLPELQLYPKFSIKNKEYQLIPSNDNEFIVYFWDLPSIFHYNMNNVMDMIIHIIMMRCENNLYDILIKTLCVSYVEPYYMEEGVFTLKINMIKNMKTIENIKKINNIIANYFNNMNKFNWDELYEQVDMMYQFIYNNSRKQDNGDVMMDIVTNMMYYKVENIYNGDKLILTKDYMILNKTIKMLEFKNASIIYGTDVELDKISFIIEPYYNKKYKPLKYGYIHDIIKQDYRFNVTIDTDVYKVQPYNINININSPIPIKLNNNNWYGGVSNFNEPFARVDIMMRNDNIFNTIISP
jgi:insulysin